MNDILNNDIKFLSGVGERRASMLRKELGIATLGDLLYHFRSGTSTVPASGRSANWMMIR